MSRRVPLVAVDRFWVLMKAGGTTVRKAAIGAGFSEGHGWKLFHARGGMPPRAGSGGSGRYLTVDERERIFELVTQGRRQCEIAAVLGRDRSTISRELKRHTGPDGRYRPYEAERAARQAARRPKPAKLAVHTELRDYVSAKLATRHSPEQISATLKHDFPDRPEMRVSHETIYQSLYVQGRGALRRELATCLRTGRAVRKPARGSDGRRERFPGMVPISERPAEAADRAVPGHWEGDLIMGADNKSAIGTLVERATRYVMLLHLPDGHRADQVREAMQREIQRLPTHLRRSITWDQGAEMAQHARFTVATGVPVYFCDPHSPWQRGSNENTNGLLRQYFPKSTDLSIHTRDHLDAVATELNDRPRKTLNWHTPAQKLNETLVASTT